MNIQKKKRNVFLPFWCDFGDDETGHKLLADGHTIISSPQF